MLKKKYYRHLRLFLLILILYSHIPPVFSQGNANDTTTIEEITEEENSNTTQVIVKPNPEKYLFTQLKDLIAEILLLIASLFAIYLRTKLQEAKKNIEIVNKEKEIADKKVEIATEELETANETVRGREEPVKLQPDEKINSVIVVGLSGSGKTSLIEAIVGEGNSEIRTARYEIFSKQILMPADNAKRACKIYISDYPGQGYIQGLVQGFIEQQKIPYSPMRYGYITSLILVVDLFAPPTNPIEQVPSSDQVDQDRITENIRIWNESSISAIFGMLTASLKYVCLFINKKDLYTGNLTEQEIKELYSPIIDILSSRGIGFKIEVYVGSALERNIGPIEEDLKKYSIDVIK